LHPRNSASFSKGRSSQEKGQTIGVDGNEAQMLLVAHGVDGKADTTARRPRRIERGPANLDQSPHVEVIDKGPPPVGFGWMKSASHLMSKSPFIVYNTNADVAKLSVEFEAFWIETDSRISESSHSRTYRATLSNTVR
jgi:hypothetical protein